MTLIFAQELKRYGPDSCYPPMRPADAQAYCSRLARSHYENFTVVSFFLPRHLIRHFHAVYAYCRWADDLADETGGGERARFLLNWWREELLRCYDGSPRHPVLIALQQTIRTFYIPSRPFLDLLLAFEQDQTIKRYQTFDQLQQYCRYSADPVGRLVLYLGEGFNEQRAALSDFVCTGLQLANFWQDVRRDLEIGRVYLPQEDLDRFGYSIEDLKAHRFTPAFAELMRFQVGRARDFFHRGTPLIALAPDVLKIEIDLFIKGGLGILRKIEEAGYDVLTRRPVLSKREKGLLLLGAFWRRLRMVAGF